MTCKPTLRKIGDYGELRQANMAEEHQEASFDRRRSYPEQLFAYRRHKNGNGHGEIVEGVQLRMLIAAMPGQRNGLQSARPKE